MHACCGGAFDCAVGEREEMWNGEGGEDDLRIDDRGILRMGGWEDGSSLLLQ
jgi:hypothetical protein